MWIFPILKPFAASQEERIFFEGDDIRGMYFLKEGSCGFVLPKYQNAKYIDVVEGSYFGITDIVGCVMQQDLDLDDWIMNKDKLKR